MMEPLDEEYVEDLGIYADLIPEGGIALYGLRLVCYIDAEGTTLHDWVKDGDVRLREIVGAIEVAKHNMIAQMDDEEEDA